MYCRILYRTAFFFFFAVCISSTLKFHLWAPGPDPGYYKHRNFPFVYHLIIFFFPDNHIVSHVHYCNHTISSRFGSRVYNVLLTADANGAPATDECITGGGGGDSERQSSSSSFSSLLIVRFEC